MLETRREEAKDLVNELMINLDKEEEIKLKNTIDKTIIDLNEKDREVENILGNLMEEIDHVFFQNESTISVKKLNIINNISNFSMNYS